MGLSSAYRILILKIFGISEESSEAFDLLPVREKDIELINSVLAGLSPVEQKVIRMVYCLDGGSLKKPSLEEVGQKIGGITKGTVTRERARQIERKALRRLRHSSRIYLLRGLFRTELERQLLARGREIKQINEIKEKEKSPDTVVIDDLNLSRRTHNCLKTAGISSLQELADCPASKLLRIRNFGQKCLEEVEMILDKYGLGLS